MPERCQTSCPWISLKKSDWRKGLVAGITRKRALVDNGWLADRLDMGVRNAVSRTIRLAGERARSDRRITRLAGKLTRKIDEQ